MPVVEIHSKWGTSEFPGNPNALHKLHEGPSYAQDLLAQGYPLGFIAGTDTHATMPSSFGDDSEHIDRLPGLTAIRADSLWRAAVYDAMVARDCWGTSVERIIIEERMAGGRMGRVVAWDGEPREFAAQVAAESNIVRVDIVRNGEDVHSAEGEGWRADVAWTDEDDLAQVAFAPRGWFERPFAYYYLRVTCASGAQAWSSPVWLTL